MPSYETIPAAEDGLLTTAPKPKASLVVGGLAAAAFILGALSMTALTTTPSVSTGLSSQGPGKGCQIQLSASIEAYNKGKGLYKCLDIPNGELKNGAPLQLYDCGDWNTGWWLEKTADGKFQIGWKDDKYCVDAYTGGAGGAQGQQLMLYECNEDPDQQWVYDHKGDGWTSLGYVNGMDTIWLSPGGTPTLCMDVADGKIDENGTPIQAWECYGGANQQWTYECFD